MQRAHYGSMVCIQATCNIPLLPQPEPMEWSKGNGKLVPTLMPLAPMCRSYHIRMHQMKFSFKNANLHCAKSCKCRGCHVYEQWALAMLWRENVTAVLVSCTKGKCVCKNNNCGRVTTRLIVIIRRAQCAEIQCINHQLSMSNVLFEVVNNIQCYFPWYMISDYEGLWTLQCLCYSQFLCKSQSFEKKLQFW